LAIEEVRAKEEARNREIKELQTQHSATLEAMADAQVTEIERIKQQHTEALPTESDEPAEMATAESLKEMQIKIASLEAELALSKNTDTPRSKSPRKKKSSKSINGNGSPALANSKGVQEPTTPNEYGTIRGGSGDDEASDISSTTPTPIKHNIEGQLAGMQEQLKHLDDIDAEMLEQHERMARTLSRVDDTVGTSEEA